MLEKLAQWNIVKYFGSLVNEKTLGDRMDKIMTFYESNTFMQAAKRLFIWALVIIIVSTIIDLTFYWLRPEQKETLQKAKNTFKHYMDKLLNKSNTKRTGKRR